MACLTLTLPQLYDFSSLHLINRNLQGIKILHCLWERMPGMKEVVLVLLSRESLISSAFGRYKRTHMEERYWKPGFINSSAYGIPVFYKANLTLDYWVGWNNFSSPPCKIQRVLHLPFLTLLIGNNYCWWIIKISFLLPLTSCWTRQLLSGLLWKPPSLTDLHGSSHHLLTDEILITLIS